ncbi:MAG: hypothetical protein PHT07_24490 [Paludibacter sp.]|nr:hypothetical protein [Paludibacter sp.]
MVVVFEGTPEEYWQKFAEVVDQRIQANDAKKVKPLSKTEACEQLGISYKTLVKIMTEMKIDIIFPADIDRILLKYPKYIKKSIRA